MQEDFLTLPTYEELYAYYLYAGYPPVSGYCFSMNKDNAKTRKVWLKGDVKLGRKSCFEYIPTYQEHRKSIVKSDDRCGVIPVIRNKDFINKYKNSESDCIKYGYFPTEIVSPELEEELSNENLIKTNNTFGNSYEIIYKGNRYVAANRLYEESNLQKHFYKVCPLKWIYLETYDILVCNQILFDIPFSNSNKKFEKKSYYESPIREILNTMYEDIFLFYNNAPYINYAYISRGDEYPKTDFCSRLETLAFFSRTHPSALYSYSVMAKAKDIIPYINNRKPNMNKIVYGEFPNERVNESILKFCHETNKKYHFLRYDKCGSTEILEYPVYSDGLNKYIYYSGDCYKIMPIEWEYADGYFVTKNEIISGINLKDVDRYLIKYFSNEIVEDRVHRTLLSNPGYAFLMNRAGIEEDNIEFDDENKLVLKK